MGKPPSRPTRLVTHDAALALLLEDLLADVPPADPVFNDVAVPVREMRPGPALQGDRLNRLATAPIPQQKVAEPAPEQDLPAWADVGFRALVFRVGEHRFAVPMIALHSVTRLDQAPTRVPRRPAWHLGLIHYRDQTTIVAELAGLLGAPSRPGGGGFLLVLGRGQAAVTCDAVEDAVDLDREAIRWRRATGRNAWLAGVVVDTLWVLLDPAALECRIRHG
jgi:chemotaxis signal transduction protein